VRSEYLTLIISLSFSFAPATRAGTVCFRLHYALCARPKFEQNIWRTPIRSSNTRRQIFKNDINDSGNNTDWTYRAHASRIKRSVYFDEEICWNNAGDENRAIVRYRCTAIDSGYVHDDTRARARARVCLF